MTIDNNSLKLRIEEKLRANKPDAAVLFDKSKSGITAFLNSNKGDEAIGVLVDVILMPILTSLQQEADEKTPEQPVEQFKKPEMEVAEPEPAPSLESPGKKVVICLATHRDYNPNVMLSILGSWKALIRDNGLENAMIFMETNTLITQARNALATRFLETGAEWSVHIDSDMIVPFGNPGWFHKKTACKFSSKFAGVTGVNRLTRGPHKLVGAVYAERSKDNRIISQPGLHPGSNPLSSKERDQELIEEIRRGPQDKVVSVGWLGFGFVAVHRDVFLDIQKKFPELAPDREGDPWNFFTGNLKASEDVAFCRRAVEAGHQPHLDLAVVCGHIGNYAFMP